MTRAKLEQKIISEIKETADKDKFLFMLFSGFSVKDILMFLEEYLTNLKKETK